MKLPTIKSRLPAVPLINQPVAPKRVTGRKLQERRKQLWLKNPHCANCGRLVTMGEFDLDHTTPLHQGGSDTKDNWQVLCNGPGGCHEAKTRAEGGKEW